MLGSGHQKLTPAQAQQIALARLVVADPHTLVLDEANLVDRSADGSASRGLDGGVTRKVVPSWRLRIGCTPHTMPTELR